MDGDRLCMHWVDGGMQQWKLYDAGTRATMVLDGTTWLENDPLAERRELVTPLLSYLFSGRFAL